MNDSSYMTGEGKSCCACVFNGTYNCAAESQRNMPLTIPKYKVKAKFTLYPAMKAQRGIALLFLEPQC